MHPIDKKIVFKIYFLFFIKKNNPIDKELYLKHTIV